MQVKDIMITRVITVNNRKSIADALAIMNDMNIRRLPVMEGNRLVGMIVQHDIEKAMHRPGIIPETPVEWIMSKRPVAVAPEDDIIRAAELLITHKISGLPVLDNGELVGIISEIDILKLFIETFAHKN
ncbi:CBS domain-containing protein [Syntrophomonas palmitatica]|uniref:CBS domain-containing protein n=1 Tax=Syntrophomonas palmitatica TaxID=402877 RepID=UPI0006D07243|nr:CBS domain-containing protein [Syntrophomonas palmitatica]